MSQGRRRWHVRLGNFEADLNSGELFCAGERVTIQNKPFRILEALLRSGGEMVERERLMEEVWPDVQVGSRSINTAIRKLRLALSDDAAKPRLIETIGNRGYRLLVPAEYPSCVESDSGTHDASALAVLPFQNLASPEDEPFTRGLTEELIVQLERVHPTLRVIVPVSAMPEKTAQRMPPLIGRELSIDYVLNGSVLRGDRNVRITARLTRTEDQVCLWSESYARKRGDILLVQEEITRQIARAFLRVLPPPATGLSLVAGRTLKRVKNL